MIEINSEKNQRCIKGGEKKEDKAQLINLWKT